MTSSVYDSAYIDSLRTLRDGILAELANDAESALWIEYEIRSKRHERVPPLEGIKILNQMITDAENAISSCRGRARNQAGFVR